MVGNGKPKLLTIAMKMSNGGGVTSLTGLGKKRITQSTISKGGETRSNASSKTSEGQEHKHSPPLFSTPMTNEFGVSPIQRNAQDLSPIDMYLESKVNFP